MRLEIDAEKDEKAGRKQKKPQKKTDRIDGVRRTISAKKKRFFGRPFPQNLTELELASLNLEISLF
jgi:hypothetical protein